MLTSFKENVFQFIFTKTENIRYFLLNPKYEKARTSEKVVETPDRFRYNLTLKVSILISGARSARLDIYNRCALYTAFIETVLPGSIVD